MGFDEIHVIFDRYTLTSLKSKTREHRTDGIQVRYKVEDDTVIAKLTTAQFLSHVERKYELTIYFSKKLVSAFNLESRIYSVVYDTVCETNIDNMDDSIKSHTHEEADSLILLYGIDVARRDPFRELDISCSDTNVFVLLLNFYKQLNIRTVFRMSKGNNIRDIDVGTAYKALGEDRCLALPGFHAFTGCDQTGKFNGHSKLTYWKTFLNPKPVVINAFHQLRKGSAITKSVELGLTSFVLDLYCPLRPSHVNELSSLRWYMFSRYQMESDKLPPTQHALHFMIFRSHSVTFIWRSSERAKPELRSPEDYGWEMKSEGYEAVMTNQLPARKHIVELSMCSCKTRCSSN